MMQPQNGIIKDVDGQLYSLVDLLQGKKIPLDPKVLETNMQPSNAVMMDKDGSLYSLVSLIGSMGGGNPAEIEQIKTDVATLKTTMELVPEGTTIVTKTEQEELKNAKPIKDYAPGTIYKRGDILKGATLDASSDICVLVTQEFTGTEGTLEGQVAVSGGDIIMTLDPTISGSSYGVNKEYVTSEWNSLSQPLITRITNVETELNGASTLLDGIIEKL